MHKLSNFTGSARHGLGFGGPRQQHDLPPPPPSIVQGVKLSRDAPTILRQTAPRYNNLSLCFNVPFSSNLAGPDLDDVIHSTPGAFARWTHAEGTEENTLNHKLPVHTENVENLRDMCKRMSDRSEGRLNAHVTSSEAKAIPGIQIGPLNALVTNVCLSGDPDLVRKSRGSILNSTPISLVSMLQACCEAILLMSFSDVPLSISTKISLLKQLLLALSAFVRACCIILIT